MDTLHRLIAAVKATDSDTVRALLDERPDLVGVRDDTGDSILLMSLYGRMPGIRDIILAHRPELSIFEAAALGDTVTVSDWLSRFPELVHAYSHDGFTALHLAAFFGHEATARILIVGGADLNAAATSQTISHRARPLHSAIAGQHEGITALLLSHGADPNAREEGGISPLHAAAAAGEEAVVRDLLAHGADADARTDDRRTAAELARLRSHSETERILS